MVEANPIAGHQRYVITDDSLDDGSDMGIPKGWCVEVDSNTPARTGNLVLVESAGESCLSIRKLIQPGENHSLAVPNTQSGRAPVSAEGFRILGVVTLAIPPSINLIAEAAR